jgi:hypothetical protein
MLDPRYERANRIGGASAPPPLRYFYYVRTISARNPDPDRYRAVWCRKCDNLVEGGETRKSGCAIKGRCCGVRLPRR